MGAAGNVGPARPQGKSAASDLGAESVEGTA